MRNISIGRLILTLVAAGALLFSTMAFSCGGRNCDDACKTETGEAKAKCIQDCKLDNKKTFVAYATDVADALEAAQPSIARLLPGKAAAFAALIPKGKQLIIAVSNSNSVEAGQLIADIFPVLEDVVSQLTNNPTVLAGLALANIGLHFLLNHMPAAPRTARLGPTMARLRTYKDAPVWGCNYKPEKCQAAGLSH